MGVYLDLSIWYTLSDVIDLCFDRSEIVLRAAL